MLFPLFLAAQAPYTDSTCSLATRICTGEVYTYPAWTGNAIAQSGPYYYCLSTRPCPAWFYFETGVAGSITLSMSSSPCRDIDFICWGPFDSLEQGCNGGLVQSKVIACSYSSACVESCVVPAAVSGKHYILLITNFSTQACTVTFSQTAGNGNMLCYQPPLISNNGPCCEGGNIQLNASGIAGATYLWTGPNAFTSTLQNPLLQNVTTNNTGIYSLTTLINNQTLGPVNMTVTVHPAPDLQILADTSLCKGSAINIGGAFSPGNTYQWTSKPIGFMSSQSNPSVSPMANTWYLLSVSNTYGCSKYDSVLLSMLPSPTAYVLPDAGACAGTPIPLGGNPSPGYTYYWASNPPGLSSSLSNPIVTPLLTTLYLLTVTNTYQCAKTYTTLITVLPKPLAMTGPDRQLCKGDSTQLGGLPNPGSQYLWTSLPPSFNATLANPKVSPSQSTTYILFETDIGSGCSGTDSVTVTVHALPAAATGPDTSVCLGVTYTLGDTAVPGNTYAWTSTPPGFSSSLANPTVSPLANTNYHLLETSAEGCAASNSISLIVKPLPLAFTGPGQNICQGSFATLGGPPVQGNLYHWTSTPAGYNAFVSNPMVLATTTTSYHLTEINPLSGCSKTNSMMLTVLALPTVSLSPFAPVCRDAVAFNLSGGNPAGGVYAGQGVNNGQFFPAALNPGNYLISYALIGANGCNGYATQPIQVLDKPKIQGTVRYNNLTLSPLDSCRVVLLNAQGLALDSCTSDESGLFRFPCLEPGTYTLLLATNKKWGGGNSIDALLMARFSVGLISFTPIQQAVGDVNVSGSINAGDALLVMRRWAGITCSFPAGDWYFEAIPPITITGADFFLEITAQCQGDVNASFQP